MPNARFENENMTHDAICWNWSHLNGYSVESDESGYSSESDDFSESGESGHSSDMVIPMWKIATAGENMIFNILESPSFHKHSILELSPWQTLPGPN